MRLHKGLILSSSILLPAGGVFGLISSADATLKSCLIENQVAPIEHKSATARDIRPSAGLMT